MFNHVLRSDQVTIDAPIETAWQVLAAVEDYGEWNPFTPSVKTDLKMGSRVDMRVQMGPIRLKQTEVVCAVEPPRLLAWYTTMGTRFLLYALREQRLEALGESQCRYVTTDAFSGLLTPLVVAVAGRAVERGFNSVAHGLKQRAEALANEGPTPS